MQRKRRILLSAIVASIVLAGIFISNIFIQRALYESARGIQPDASLLKEAVGLQAASPSPQTEQGQQVTRWARLVPGNDYIEYVFFQGNREIARQKVVGEEIIEQTGEVPEGKVSFVDQQKSIYGDEYYRDGVRHGIAHIYYANGRPFKQLYYRHGRLISSREYYDNGNIRFEVDYEDARKYPGDTEVGIGRLYYRNGTLKYEWQLLASEKIGYKRSYNPDGTVRFAAYYDEKGNLLPSSGAVPVEE